MSFLSSQWDKLLISNWKGNLEYIKTLKKEEFPDDTVQIKEKAINARNSIINRGSIIQNLRNSNIYDPEQFVSFKQFDYKLRFSKHKRVSIMNQRLQNKQAYEKFDNLIPSVMPYTLDILPSSILKKEL